MWAARGQPTAGFSGLLKTISGLCEMAIKAHVF